MTSNEETAFDAVDASRMSLAGASPAVPRDERLLSAERAEYEAQLAQEQAEALKREAEDAAARAVAAKANAERSMADLEAAREEAKERARAAALQVRLEQDERERELRESRIQAREDRNEKLGTVEPVEDDVEPEVVTVTKRASDGFLGSLGLFIARLALAVFTGVIGWQAMVNHPAVTEALDYVGIHSGGTPIAVGMSVLLLLAAVLLLFGVMTRIVTIVMAIFGGLFLAFFRFGNFSPFILDKFGFYGDREVLVVTLALVLATLGAGGWSVDRAIRHRRDHRDDEDI